MKVLKKLRALFRKEKLEADMAEEIRMHLELQTELNLKTGMSPDEARYLAQRQFGNVASIQEQAREVRTWRWLEDFTRDVRFAVRALRRNPGYSFVAVLTLTFGIGVNTSMFTALQSLLMRPLPYQDADRLVQVFRTSSHSQRWPHAPANFLDQQKQNTVFSHMAAVNGKPFNLAEPGQPAERVRGLQVSADLFPLLGVQPALGRTFTADEDRPGLNHVVVLSHGVWLRRFAGDPSILGRILRLDGESVTVVGVMPAAFRDNMLFGPVELWRPIAFSASESQNRGGNYLKSIARLRPGVSLVQAQAELDVLALKHAREFPESNSGIGLKVVPLSEAMDPRARVVIWLAMLLAGFVLLIACANLANLQFARTARRTHELAIRGALGASRERLLRQLLTESLLIAFGGGLLGLVLANWGNALLSRLIIANGEEVLRLSLNLKVLGFAFLASTASGLMFGLVPAWMASRISVNDTLKQGSRGATGSRSRHRLQHALIVAEMALALVLLAGAGLVVRGLHQFVFQNPGWQVEGLTVGYLSLPEGQYGSEVQQRAFADRLQEKLAALPGVERAALAWSLPISGFNVAGDFKLDDRPPPAPGHEPLRFVNGVTPGYFEALGMRLVTGRNFTAADSNGRTAVVIINETMARTFWPDGSPIGRHIEDEEIVGVVSDVRFPADPTEPQTHFQTYRPFAQAPRGYLGIAIRGIVSVDALRRVVAELDPDLPLNEPGPAGATVDRFLRNMSVVGGLLSGFALLGLLLASIGIYGVIAGFVAQRTNEIGIRMALGAQVSDVLRLVIGQGLRLALLGTAIGLVGAMLLARVLASLLPGLGGNDPFAIVVVVALLLAVAGFACWLPAHRAGKIDPLAALRAE